MVLIWITLMANDMSIFSCAYGHWYIFFREMCIKILKAEQVLYGLFQHQFLVHDIREQKDFLECYMEI